MKPVFFITLFLIICHQGVFAQVLEQKQERKRNTVNYKTAAYFYPFAAITDNFRIALEHKPSEMLGLRGVFNFGYGEDNIFYDADEFASFGGELQARYYPTRGNPAVYTGAFVGAKSITITRNDGIYYDQNGFPVHTLKEYSAQAFSFGVIGGLQFEIAKVFLLDAYIGAGPNIPTGDYRLDSNFGSNIWGYRKGMRYNGGLNFGVILFK